MIVNQKEIFACLEVGPGGAGIFLPQLPGCWIFGKTKESARRKIHWAIGGWCRWARGHGEKLSWTAEEISVIESELLTVTYNPVQAGKPEPLFWSEVQTVGPEDIRWAKRLMAYAREDLLRLVEDLRPEALDWQPPDHPRSIRNCLDHIARVEWWYLTRLEVELSEELPEDVFELLRVTREMVWHGLDELPAEKYGGVFQPKKYVSSEGTICNLWTARKVLRRFVDHERLHTRYIVKVLDMYHREQESSRAS
jgi:predicted RNase H-like HicB family nuclease